MVTIEEFKNNITKKSRLLGLDLGTKRIGIAICDDNQSVATPFKTVNKAEIHVHLEATITADICRRFAKRNNHEFSDEFYQHHHDVAPLPIDHELRNLSKNFLV